MTGLPYPLLPGKAIKSFAGRLYYVDDPDRVESRQILARHEIGFTYSGNQQSP